MPTRLTLRAELLAMRDEDLRIRQKLLDAGELRKGYHPGMSAIHSKNAARMREIIAEYGWPTRTIVGIDGEEAAWLVVQHAIGDPELQRDTLERLEAAAASGEAPTWQFACLADRIAYFEGRPQRYGTQFDWDDDGCPRVYQLEEPGRVDANRRSVGLGPLEHPTRKGKVPMSPEEIGSRRQEAANWAKSVGWRE
jgi:hypothetical protein